MNKPIDLKKESKKANEILEAMGHESEKEGIKWAKYFIDKFDEKELEKNQIKEEKLYRKAKFKRIGYHRLCWELLKEEVDLLEHPTENSPYHPKVSYTKFGVSVEVHDLRTRQIYTRGFKPCGYPKYDLAAIREFTVWTQDVMWELDEIRLELRDKQGNKIKTKSGIYVK